jgi:hypothetical protein
VLIAETSSKSKLYRLKKKEECGNLAQEVANLKNGIVERDTTIEILEKKVAELEIENWKLLLERGKYFGHEENAI